MERRILIYRLGSLGDTVVALPALKLIARAYPDAERWMLTNITVSSSAASMESVLDGTGLVHRFLEYPVGLRNVRALLELRNQIRKLRPEVLVYLTEPRHKLSIFRDWLFFYLCGITAQVGVPSSLALRKSVEVSDGLYEYEGLRLVRCLRSLGNIDLSDANAFDLDLSDEDDVRADSALSGLAEASRVLAVGVGTKVDVNDWGEENWLELIGRLSEKMRDWSLVLLGANGDKERSEALLAQWSGAGVNLCGEVNVRTAAAILSRAKLYVGHDSGPMHLAAAVGTQCVAIFSSRNLPGIWFPYGSQHRVLYHRIPCQGCQLEICSAYAKACIKSITVEEVERAVVEALGC